MNFKRFKKNLPDAYQELEYIQSGLIYLQTGYIDTGLVGTDLYGCEIETCMKITAINNANLYYLNGAYVSGQTTQIGLIREDTEYVHSVANIGFNAVSYSGSIALSDWHTIYTSDGIQKTDGIIVSNETYGTLNNLRYLLFARSDTGVTLSPPFAMKYFWVKKNGQYIRNMIPAKRKSDNVVGMYDIANDVFYTSANQYTFIGGNDVEPTWQDTPHYIHNTSTDTITTPAVIYTNDNNATVGLKGNMEQSGTPTPTIPIQPQECGDLETEGAKAGQYKIPISSASTTTPVYLGEVESTRQIKKLVLTGNENISETTIGSKTIFQISQATVSDKNYEVATETMICSHYKVIDGRTNLETNDNAITTYNASNNNALLIRDDNCETLTDFTTYLTQQYSAGTPVTIWYVLATPTTGIVNAPLRKIGTYADEVSGITIPTIAGADTLSVDTTLQPSEVTANYHGWHSVTDVHERENGAWT